MMFSKRKNQKWWAQVPPWIILGAVLILAPIFLFVTMESVQRQKENTIRLLLEKGAALIRSFEAGARTGMMGMQWGGGHVQRFLMETAQQQDVLYIRVTDENGIILADSDMSRIGTFYESGLDLKQIADSKGVQWRQVKGDVSIFEVYRQFIPMRGRGRGHRPEMMAGDWCRPHFDPGPGPERTGQIIFLGLDMTPVEEARKDDTRRTVLLAFILLLVGFAGIVSLFLAQAYRTAKSSLSRVQAFSDNLVAHMPVGLIGIDQEGRLVSFNQAAEQTLRRSAASVLMRSAAEVLPQALIETLRSVEGKGPLEREISCLVDEDKIIPLEVVGTALQGEDGPLGHVILFRDLSELKRLQKELARSQHLASIGRLAAGVAHEIRNPLSSIKGFATYFKERYRENPQDKQTAEIMIGEVERLNRVIGQLLEFARPAITQKKTVSLPSLVDQSLKMMEGDAAKKGIQIHLRSFLEREEVNLDPDKILQVLLNLYLNAIEAMEQGGVLSVELGPGASGRFLDIIISDTGLGIKDEDLPHVFDPYFTTKSSGTGLGLAIVYKIIEAHDGEVRVESRVGKGTRFFVSLPVTTQADRLKAEDC